MYSRETIRMSTNAECAQPNATNILTFDQYINKCRHSKDTVRTNGLFSNYGEKVKDIFDSLRAQGTDLIATGDAISALGNLSGNTSSGVEERLNNLQSYKKSLLSEIESHRNISNIAEKSFLEDIMNGNAPKKELIPSLQDATLLLFWFGWLIMVLVLTSIRWFSPGGTFFAGLFTFLLLALITCCMYALLVKIA